MFFKNYDGQFIVDEFLKRLIPTDTELGVIMDGRKIMSVSFRDIEIKDSSLFISARLETFPKMFGLKELKKGFFPYSFNVPEHYEYNGPWPPKNEYKPEFMSPSKRLEFEKFYEENKDNIFNFMHEFESYCW
jgi:hypothetical protein